MDAAGHGQREGPGRGLAGTGEVVRLRDPGKDTGQVRIGAEVRQQAVAHPAPHLLAVDHQEPDLFAGGDGRPGQPVPLRTAARKFPDVPLDAGVLRLEVVEHLPQRRFGAGLADVGDDRDRAGQGAASAVGPAGVEHAASRGATTPPAATIEPNLRMSRRSHSRGCWGSRGESAEVTGG